ncbi:MAG TPA: hypothetical protein VGI45_27550 [Terracidiphilus sp.]
MCKRFASLLLLGALAILSTACKKETIDKGQFKSAINSYLGGRHDCVWPEPVKMPAEADPSKDERTRDFDALTDAGLLARAPEEKKRFLIGSKPVNLYDLSDKGHAAWIPDPHQPGYGNFCFGHFNVTSVDNYTPDDPSNPTQYAVNYHYEVEGIPSWANTAESRLTFPKIAADTSIQTATVTIVKGTNGGWAVVPPQPAPSSK